MLRYLPAIFYSAPGAPTGGAPPAPVGEPAAPPPQGQPQPGAPGQGQPQGNGFRQTFFANVPDDQWAVIEPHMANVNRHVDQLQQTYAPLKGMSPQAVQNLAQFSQQFETDPVGQWIRLAQALQQRGIVDPDLDLEYLSAIAMGQDPPEDEPQQQQNGNGLDPNNPLTQTVLDLQKQIEQLSGQFTQQNQTQRERAEDVALQRQLGFMKQKLQEGGFPDNVLTNEFLLSSFIAHRGDANRAIESATGLRTNMLSGFVQDPTKKQQTKQDLDMPNGAPPPPRNRPKPSSNKRGMFKDVEAAAEQALRAADNG